MDIKTAISVLCKLLSRVYHTSLKPEHFRLAKFNKNEENVVENLWDALGKILKCTNTNLIHQHLQTLHYTRVSFCNSNCGSRELLLALGFLLSFLLEQELEHRLEFSPLPECSTITSITEFEWKKLDQNELTNYHLWLTGRISSNQNATQQYKEQILKIQEKLNKNLNIKAHTPLTVYEILALQNSNMGQKFLEDTEPIVHLIKKLQRMVEK